MADKIRSVALVGLGLAVVAAGCTGPDAPPPPPTSSTPLSITGTQLDVSRYLSTPCSGVPAALTAQLGLVKPQDAHDTVLVTAGDQSQCRFTSGPPLSAAAEVRFYPKARPLPLVSGPGSQVKATSVAGYPAGEWVLSTGTDGSFTSCQIIVDIADSQGLGTLYNGPAGEPVTTSCAKTRQLAEGVLAALPR
ncbi:DUF3558 family protein [Amycolatopsis sp. WQ 127309]|uniref:DUF3558 family protein n=1 Tax=Amycolatopsis sp. WQ 127309 TaxID=2932773 RepID=UPI001FF2005D|nr:DUF3558 family protein [Amycolatopsis sp. WQ 127309]UOZ03303.1 DUF3558 domain-containing protein [Amycolatopsis sp. WQ 127309]